MLTHAPSALAVSFTLGHSSSTPISESFDALHQVKNELHRGGGWYRLAKHHGIVGFGLVTEFNFSDEKGPHPHWHGFYYLNSKQSSKTATPVVEALQARWTHAAHRLGYEAHSGAQDPFLVPSRDRDRRKLADYLAKDHADNWWPHGNSQTIGSIRHQAVNLNPHARVLYDELVEATAGRNRTVRSPNLAVRLGISGDARNDSEQA